MDQFNMDLRLEYGDEDFDFGSQMSSASSARSFSTASSCAPITPQSGRSSPQQSSSMDFDPSIGYEITPSNSTLDGYLTAEVKPEFSICDGLLETPTRKPMLPTYTMDFEQPGVLDSMLPSHGSTMEFARPHGLENYSFSEHMTSSPFSNPPPPYSLTNPSCESNSIWTYQGDNSMIFLDKTESPAVPSSARHLPIHNRSALPPSYLASNGRRQLCMEDVQQKSSVLHRVQYGGRVHPKRERYGRGNGHGHQGPHIPTITTGQFKCTFPECAGRKAYKRSEHLKRHKNSFHQQNPDENNKTCDFCGHVFNRRDNWRQHLKLHTMDARPIARTQFYPEAKALYDAEMKRTKHRNPSKKRMALKEQT
ncbi:hypothetical protein BJ170DRAFT_696358 [Xylariales sp. AK1849]|nr:hypothetical protein BJ170DRAFT_696358 [Xylariales sp. AK1849]